jgi:hypothetical protein
LEKSVVNSRSAPGGGDSSGKNSVSAARSPVAAAVVGSADGVAVGSSWVAAALGRGDDVAVSSSSVGTTLASDVAVTADSRCVGCGEAASGVDVGISSVPDGGWLQAVKNNTINRNQFLVRISCPFLFTI